MMATETGYNGWKNYETWNVALWVNNDESMYRFARSRGFMGWDRTPKRNATDWPAFALSGGSLAGQ